MKSKISNPYYHIIYWVVVVIGLIFIFGRSWNDKRAAFYYVSMLLPVIMGTSYFFNYYLVPKYLLTKKYFSFGLYLVYTLVVSLYLEMLVLTIAFIYLVRFYMGEMGSNARDRLLLAIVMYLVVLLGSFLVMLQQLAESKQAIRQLTSEKEKMLKSFLEIVSARKKVKIPYNDILYIESLDDYIQIHTATNKPVRSKAKISHLENQLPEIFLRIHRSFIVNTENISSFNYNEVEINGVVLNIGRSFKKEVRHRLKIKN